MCISNTNCVKNTQTYILTTMHTKLFIDLPHFAQCTALGDDGIIGFPRKKNPTKYVKKLLAGLDYRIEFRWNMLT